MVVDITHVLRIGAEHYLTDCRRGFAFLSVNRRQRHVGRAARPQYTGRNRSISRVPTIGEGVPGSDRIWFGFRAGRTADYVLRSQCRPRQRWTGEVRHGRAIQSAVQLPEEFRALVEGSGPLTAQSAIGIAAIEREAASHHWRRSRDPFQDRYGTRKS
jgi:hypothetical protein